MHDVARSSADLDGVRLARSLSRSFALHVGVRAIEALAIGWLAAALVAASAALTMRASVSGQAWTAAAVCAICAAASVWFPHPPRRDEHVRDADRRLVLGGALVTSVQILPTARAGSLSAALVRRVAQRAQSSALLRAALPRTPLALLAALAGSAILFAAQDAVPAAATKAAPEQVAAALGAAASALRSAALEATNESSTPSGGAALTVLAQDLDHAAREHERPATASGPEGRAPGEADRLEKDIDSARASARSPRASRALDQARAAVEIMRRPELASSKATGLGAGSQDPTGASTAGSQSASPSPFSKSADGSSAGALASAAANGRMSAPNADPRAHPGPRAIVTTSGAGERGVGATRWWPSSYDAIVEGWLAGDASGR